jgi:hypothetical protein
MTESGQKDIRIIVQNDQMRSMILVIGIISFVLISFPILLSEFGQSYFLLLLLLAVIFFASKLIYFLQAKRYKKVRAKINDYYLIEHKRYDEESNMPSLDYEVRIKYTYQYNGTKYYSEKVGIDRSRYYFKQKFYFTDKNEARNDSLNYLNSFVKNPALSAYVNPLYPKEAVLDANINIEVIALNISYILIAITIFLWLVDQ